MTPEEIKEFLEEIKNTSEDRSKRTAAFIFNTLINYGRSRYYRRTVNNRTYRPRFK